MILEFLRKVYGMEKNKYLLWQMSDVEKEKMGKIDNKIKELNEEKKQKEPQMEELPVKQEPPSFLSKFLESFFVTGIVAGFVYLLFIFCGGGEEVLSFIRIPLIVFLAVIVVVIAAVSARYKVEEYQYYLIRIESVKRRNTNRMEEYKKLCDKLEIMETDLNHEKIQCQKNGEYIQEKITELEKTLNSYYGLNVLYGKYCGLEAVCKILEYMQSGRCTSLYGPSGAYDTYEKEYRADIVIDRLDTLIYKLDEIKATNILLSLTMQQVNCSLNEVYSGISEQQNTLREIGTSLGRGIGIMEQNAQAGRLLSEITNTNLRDIREFEEYQSFVMKQERLNNGHWC